MPKSVNLAATGVPGLDDILFGGLTADRMYLLEGDPGAGKTTLALQFLLTGVRLGETGLYVTLSETRDEIEGVVAGHGWNLDSLNVHEVMPGEDELDVDGQYTMFHPSEVELGHTMQRILTEVERLDCRRVVIDSLSELRLLAQGALRYRRQVLALKQFFAGRKSTVLLLDDRSAEGGDAQLRSIAHGVIQLEQLAPEYGAERRRIRIAKLRGRKYRGGFHDFVINHGGLEVFPRLIAAEHRDGFLAHVVPSGIARLDEMLGGGASAGKSMIVMGPAGSGKSSLAVQYACAAAERGEHAAMFIFDEALATLLERADGLGLPARAHVAAGRISVLQVDPAELSPGEFVAIVRGAASPTGSRGGASVIVIDSLNGYMNAMPSERHLIIQLHELLTYLGQLGVLSVLVVAQHGVIGQVQSPIDASYLADTVILTRYYEFQGEVHQALSVMKHRTGNHDRAIRELSLGMGGLQVGGPIRNLQGVLAGMPRAVTGALDAHP